MNYNYTQMVREIKSAFECKIHPNTRFNSYCHSCKLNICEKCLGKNSPHVGHHIFYFSKIILSEKYTKYYQTLYFFCKYYLNCIKDIVVELLSDLSDINIKEKKLIIGLKSQLKTAYKIFHKLNTYQMHYTKYVLSTYLNCKRLGYFNYQIIKNVYSIKLNSVRIPDLDDKDILNKVKTIIDFLRCTKDNNNILKDSDSELPNTVYSYVDYNTISNPKINMYSVKPPFIEAYVETGETYEPKENNIHNDNELNEKQNKKNEDKNIINTNINNNEDKTEENTEEKSKTENKNVESEINKEKSNNINNITETNTNNINNKINNNSINSEINEEEKNSNINNNNIKIKNIQTEDKKTSSSPITSSHTRSQIIEESKSKSTPPLQNIPNHIPTNIKKLESKKESLYASNRITYEFEEEIRNKFFGDITNQSNNENIKKLIYDHLTKTCPEEVEYKDKVEYIYHDKLTNKDISCCYFGEFKKGTLKRHGRGLFIWKDSETYLGYWANDKRDGDGTNTYANGNTYQGHYKNGKKEGYGVYKWKNGDIYSGYWKNDMKDGKGLYKFANGDVYDGMFKNDKINGKGLYTWANKIGYKGQFKNNMVEKNGILKYTVNRENNDGNIFNNKENNNSSKSRNEDFENSIEEEKNEINENDIKNDK